MQHIIINAVLFVGFRYIVFIHHTYSQVCTRVTSPLCLPLRIRDTDDFILFVKLPTIHVLGIMGDGILLYTHTP